MSKEAESPVMWALSPGECTNKRESEVIERKLGGGMMALKAMCVWEKIRRVKVPFVLQ